MNENKMKVEFAPGAFDNFEGTQEELDELVAEIKNMFEGKSHKEIKSIGRPVDFDELFEEDPHVAESILKSFNKEQKSKLQ
jgi:hypothetical protein